MRMPFTRTKPLPVRVLQTAAAAAGVARLAMRQRTLRPTPPKPERSRLGRMLHRG
jgi:hypothetical protein